MWIVKKDQLKIVNQDSVFSCGEKEMLRKVTLFAIVGIFYLFLLRTVGTFYQHIFRENLTLVQITKALALLAILAFVFFFACFLKYCLGKKRTELKGATVFVLMGYILMTVLYLKDLLSVFNVKGIFSPYFIEPFIPLVGSLSLLVFFIVFYKNPLTKSRKNAEKFLIFPVVGATIDLIIRSFILLRYFYFRDIRWFADLPEKFKIIVTPLVFFSFLMILYFFIYFYKYTEK